MTTLDPEVKSARSGGFGFEETPGAADADDTLYLYSGRESVGCLSSTHPELATFRGEPVEMIDVDSLAADYDAPKGTITVVQLALEESPEASEQRHCGRRGNATIFVLQTRTYRTTQVRSYALDRW